jgi:hypothetical protein
MSAKRIDKELNLYEVQISHTTERAIYAAENIQECVEAIKRKEDIEESKIISVKVLYFDINVTFCHLSK